jgi:hypothetical protein
MNRGSAEPLLKQVINFTCFGYFDYQALPLRQI